MSTTSIGWCGAEIAEAGGEPDVRVVIDALSAREGGGQTYLRNLLAHDPGPDLDVVVLAPATLSLPHVSPRVTRVDAPETATRPIFRTAWGRLRLPLLLRLLRPGVFFSPGGTLPGGLPTGCRSITMSRNMLPFDARQRRRYPFGYARAKACSLQFVLLHSMRQADLVIFVSEYAKQVVQRRAGGQLQRTVVIPHGVSGDFRLTGDVPRPSWLPKEDYILYVSNFEPYKSHLEVVRAFGILKRRLGCPERLLLVGRPSVRLYAQAVRQEIERLGLVDEVIMTGSQPHAELPAVYHHARIGVFASECENCPNILLEGMAAALPLAVSNLAPMPEFAGDAAIYFDPRQPNQIADSLQALLTNKDLAKALSKRAETRASLYDWSRTARRTWDSIAQTSAL